ncbi:hypothetical protein [Solimonas sp. SE-A11]|uniref:hypothetical protein n=1 Tax=Solimonas sp. SE-A11 TaxID=3054954 RepID=UPI00259CEAA5|nr:hypothetical protein [Solimonas sp. SE-A11]MDM4771987.1 hypothetical protein [Solimonas sp. SE-A11]
MTDKKDFDDVSQLVDRLQLDGLKYREFGDHRPAKLKLAGGTAPTAAPAAAPALPVQASRPAAAVPVAAAPAEAARTIAAPAPAPLPEPARTVEQPLSFTFERLRRQVIGSRVQAPVLQLQLAPRKASGSEPQDSVMQKPVSNLFAQMGQDASSAVVDPLRLKR